MPGRSVPGLDAAHLDSAHRRVDPEQRLEQLAPTRTDEPCDTDDLARADVEADVFERSRQRQAAHAEHGRLVIDALVTFWHVLERAPDHQLDQTRSRDRADLAAADGAAVAKHRHPIGDGEDLVQAVRDEDRRHPLLAEPPDDREQRLDPVVGERARGLVEDDDARVDRERAGDLDELLLVRPKAPNGCRRVEVEAQPGKCSAGAPPRCPPVDQASALDEAMTQEDVLRNRELGRKRRLLGHRGDAAAQRLVRAADVELPAAQDDLGGVGPNLPGENLEQGRLPRSVLADERMHLAVRHLQARPPQCVDAAIALVHAFGAEQGLAHVSTLAAANRSGGPLKRPERLLDRPADRQRDLVSKRSGHDLHAQWKAMLVTCADHRHG